MEYDIEYSNDGILPKSFKGWKTDLLWQSYFHLLPKSRPYGGMCAGAHDYVAYYNVNVKRALRTELIKRKEWKVAAGAT